MFCLFNSISIIKTKKQFKIGGLSTPKLMEIAPAIPRLFGALVFPRLFLFVCFVLMFKNKTQSGLYLIVVTGSDLFTSNVMTFSIALWQGKISATNSTKLLVLCYVGNLIGSWICVLTLVLSTGIFLDEVYYFLQFVFDDSNQIVLTKHIAMEILCDEGWNEQSETAVFLCVVQGIRLQHARLSGGVCCISDATTVIEADIALSACVSLCLFEF